MVTQPPHKGFRPCCCILGPLDKAATLLPAPAASCHPPMPCCHTHSSHHHAAGLRHSGPCRGVDGKQRRGRLVGHSCWLLLQLWLQAHSWLAGRCWLAGGRPLASQCAVVASHRDGGLTPPRRRAAVCAARSTRTRQARLACCVCPRCDQQQGYDKPPAAGGCIRAVQQTHHTCPERGEGHTRAS